MKSEKKIPEKPNQEVDSGTLKSMFFSLFLVGLSLLFVFGFHKFLQTKQNITVEEKKNSEEILTVDPSFDKEYILIRNAEKEALYITQKPGEVTADSKKVTDGQLLSVAKKGQYKGKKYYRLSDWTYIEARPSQIQEIIEYVPLKGYIAITYISSAGVHLRSWIDFKDDSNVVGTVFVGDRVDVIAMLTTSDGVSAFQTKEGNYITTDSSYFSDYTNLKEQVKSVSDQAMENTTEYPDNMN